MRRKGLHCIGMQILMEKDSAENDNSGRPNIRHHHLIYRLPTMMKVSSNNSIPNLKTEESHVVKSMKKNHIIHVVSLLPVNIIKN
mmetsp:Transcript_456/g.858  ORF Transcript_456/g.858 Transcript_456/m.858 type:complete len:85 (+) Transcript_456:396-650(+)